MSSLGKWILAALFIGIISYWFFRHSGYMPFAHNPMQFMPDMHRTPVMIPMRASPLFEDGASARPQPEGTLGRAQIIYPHTIATPADQVPPRANPLPKTREVLERGKFVYEQNCTVCHGVSGMGDGAVVGPYPKPPLLMSDKLVSFSDSSIYHVVTVGQNIMGAYGPKIRENDRWAVVHYVRVLQRAYTPTPEDLLLFKQDPEEAR